MEAYIVSYFLPILSVLTILFIIVAYIGYHSDKNFIKESVLSPTKASKALDDLCEFCSKNNIDTIVGINRGGILVGAYVAVKLGIADGQLLRCSVPLIGEDANCSISDHHFIGNVLVVDDVCRTGRTIKKALKRLRNNLEKTNKTIVAVLAATAEENESIYKKLDFYGYQSNRPDLKMPWHSEEANEYILRAIEEKRKTEYLETSKKTLLELDHEIKDILTV